jgi:hypothetical protein
VAWRGDDLVQKTCSSFNSIEQTQLPMHPEVQTEEPGSCPKCRTAIEPSQPAATAGHTEYTCPMHLEFVRDQPGNCPISGMPLEHVMCRSSQKLLISQHARRLRVIGGCCSTPRLQRRL